MVYARKITEDSWFYKPALDSDAISELGTSDHELSVWKVEDITDTNCLNNIALALALSRDAVDELYMVFIDPQKIKSEYKWEVELRDQEGRTGYESMKDEHTNFLLFTYWHQGFLAEHINKLIQNAANYRYYDVSTLVDLLKEAVDNGNIDRGVIKKRFGKWNQKLKELENGV